ncbi:MAG: DNA-3-methyladenine glycosylase [Chitinophagaceae bacterium]|nr:DNA-3-methyladenine glycosylase [Chitinophagaceae bacterium]
MKWKKLDERFYQRCDVVLIARQLLGKLLITRFGEGLTSGRIVETEAYAGTGDRASHAYGGRRTERNEAMYAPGGTAYVYLCYGIHHLFNVVTHKKDVPHAILIRALEPAEGLEIMRKRTGKSTSDFTLTRGPGNLTRAMGITVSMNGYRLTGNELYIADDGFSYPDADIQVSPRIGVDYAGEDALLPYRFFVRDNPWVSGKKVNVKMIGV